MVLPQPTTFFQLPSLDDSPILMTWCPSSRPVLYRCMYESIAHRHLYTHRVSKHGNFKKIVNLDSASIVIYLNFPIMKNKNKKSTVNYSVAQECLNQIHSIIWVRT
jgi:hypothetical protein